MSLTMTIVMLIAGWLAVAAAMLWGCCGLRGVITIPLSLRLLKRLQSTAYVTPLRIDFW